tara:strand:- start:13468 stop:14073 length:606 start_codon:yes stop_codon:yes gene_type:complete
MGSILAYSLIKNHTHDVVSEIVHHFHEEGHTFFEKGDLNLNIIGIRSPDRHSGEYNDYICCVYKDNGDWLYKAWRATTDPGLPYRKRPMNSKGCAILKAGQYRGAYQIGLHKGKYEALVQRGGQVTVYRDNNKDDTLDRLTEDSGYFGINIHKSLRHHQEVGLYSAGCQVFQNSHDFKEFMLLVKRSSVLYGDTFTYTLIE